MNNKASITALMSSFGRAFGTNVFHSILSFAPEQEQSSLLIP